MIVGSNFVGDYSRFSFNEAKRYLMMLKEQGKPVLDDEFNLLQEIFLQQLRRLIMAAVGNGVAPGNNGFLIVGTGAANNFTITGGGGTVDTAGYCYVDGYRVTILNDLVYTAQEFATPTLPALTTPAGARVDEVYLDVWLDEVTEATDPVLIDPTLGAATSKRAQLKWQVRVAEGSTTPAPYSDANGLPHLTLHIATLNRTAQAAIDPGMVVDVRPNIGNAQSLLAAHEAAADPHPQYLERQAIIDLAGSTEGRLTGLVAGRTYLITMYGRTLLRGVGLTTYPGPYIRQTTVDGPILFAVNNGIETNWVDGHMWLSFNFAITIPEGVDTVYCFMDTNIPATIAQAVHLYG